MKNSFSNVPGTGIEPVRLLRPQDFKSCVSTSSTTRAEKSKMKKSWRKRQDFC